jgi:hypothetical protein
MSFLLFISFLFIFFEYDFSFGQLAVCELYGFVFALDSKSVFLILLTLFIFPVAVGSS